MAGDKVVYFVRHGEAAHNIDSAALNTPDNPLTPHGIEQASGSLRACLRSIVAEEGELDAVITSPMTRAIETCLYSTEGLLGGEVVPRVEPLCTERGYLLSRSITIQPQPSRLGRSVRLRRAGRRVVAGSCTPRT